MKNDVISPEFDENGRPLRRIRSFVRRQGRLTKGQQHALDNYWPVMGVEFSEQPLDFTDLFGRDAPVTLEIGFGMGTSLVTMAKARPEQNSRYRSTLAGRRRVHGNGPRRALRTCASCVTTRWKCCTK